jgi:hypothetical protein
MGRSGGSDNTRPEPTIADGRWPPAILVRASDALSFATAWRARPATTTLVRMPRERVGSVMLPALCAVLAIAGASHANAAPAGSVSAKVRIVFTGKGGGRYLDITRWLREDTRECYARRTADETVSVAWKIAWTARLVEKAGHWKLVAPVRKAASIAGTVTGNAVRDSCDAADEEPGWSGSSACNRPLPVRSQGGVRISRGGSLHVRGPTFGSPGTPCELDVRNDQLQSHLLAPDSLQRLVEGGKSVSVLVGTARPTPVDAYVPTQFCSAFPHIYEGVVYLYYCLDTLIWHGKLSVSRA